MIYVIAASIPSHGSWFFAQLYFVKKIIEYKTEPLWIQGLICLFYVFFCTLGTVVGQRIALRLEAGDARPGA